MAAWRDLQSILPRELTRFEDADQETGVLQMLGNWVADMLGGVFNGARTDAALVTDALAFVRWVKRFEDGPSASIAADPVSGAPFIPAAPYPPPILPCSRRSQPAHSLSSPSVRWTRKARARRRQAADPATAGTSQP